MDSGRDDESVEGPSEHEDEDDDDEDDYDVDSDIAEASQLAEYQQGRKQSVVSVSTIISTKTEAISPQPPLRPTLSRDSTQSSEAEEEDETAAQLAELSSPPFFRALLLLAEMSSAGNLLTPEYTAQCCSGRSRRSLWRISKRRVSPGGWSGHPVHNCLMLSAHSTQKRCERTKERFTGCLLYIVRRAG